MDLHLHLQEKRKRGNWYHRRFDRNTSYKSPSEVIFWAKEKVCCISFGAIDMALFLLAQVALWVVCLGSSNAFLFNHRAGWLKANPANRSNTLSSQCFKLWGGASSSDASDEKVKGLCIGIDLGTTTRFVIFLFVSSLSLNHLFSNYLQLCCCLEEWSCWSMSQRTRQSHHSILRRIQCRRTTIGWGGIEESGRDQSWKHRVWH